MLAVWRPFVDRVRTRTPTATRGGAAPARGVATRSVQRATASSTRPPSAAGVSGCALVSTKWYSSYSAVVVLAVPPPRGDRSATEKLSSTWASARPAARLASCSASCDPWAAHGVGAHAQP